MCFLDKLVLAMSKGAIKTELTILSVLPHLANFCFHFLLIAGWFFFSGLFLAYLKHFFLSTDEILNKVNCDDFFDTSGLEFCGVNLELHWTKETISFGLSKDRLLDADDFLFFICVDGAVLRIVGEGH